MLLGSKQDTDIKEAIDFFVSAFEFGVQNSMMGVRYCTRTRTRTRTCTCTRTRTCTTLPQSELPLTARAAVSGLIPDPEPQVTPLHLWSSINPVTMNMSPVPNSNCGLLLSHHHILPPVPHHCGFIPCSMQHCARVRPVRLVYILPKPVWTVRLVRPMIPMSEPVKKLLQKRSLKMIQTSKVQKDQNLKK